MIRKANEEDIRVITEIFSETKTPWSEESVRASIEKDEFYILEEDEVCAAVAFSKIAPEGEILNFAVKNTRRRKGYGEKLLSESISKLCEEGIETVFLDVRESNTPAINLYRKIGFIETGVRKRFYQNPCEDALLMVLNIYVKEV